MQALAPEIRIVKDAEELTRAAAGELVRCAKESAGRQGRFTVALAGGNTPLALYELLATQPTFRTLLPWEKSHFFWGDERHVPPDHADNHYRKAQAAMFSRVTLPAENIHRVPAENPDAAAAAGEYEAELRRFFDLQPGKLPRFDLALLGMGPDGHIAALFPGSEALGVQDRLAVATRDASLNTEWITLTLPVLNNAATVVFLACGREKAETLREVLRRVEHPAKGAPRFPAELVRPVNGRLLWVVDQGAAGLLTPAR
ncbi:MAG: 6-phosphogluconolactonase [Acidobacteria bacterium]|nr:6-phosphogluconolactonase [Acidobacteriota bacterium]MBI3663026.1 6-phosphogluconolactonase [Acidobacteriota bacterium]